jgi:hypothetical protein
MLSQDEMPKSDGGEGADLLEGAAVAGDEEDGNPGELPLLQVAGHLPLPVHVQTVLRERLKEREYTPGKYGIDQNAR